MPRRTVVKRDRRCHVLVDSILNRHELPRNMKAGEDLADL